VVCSGGYLLSEIPKSGQRRLLIAEPPYQGEIFMRTLELIAALVLAAAAFIAVKLIGFVLHIALIAAVLGLVVGFVIARAFRRPA
jgi:membrane associated rhomboid family serine protease